MVAETGQQELRRPSIFNHHAYPNSEHLGRDQKIKE
jgi:hypothetical protein